MGTKTAVKTPSVRPNNLQHNVPAHRRPSAKSLVELANTYLVTEVSGQAAATLDAKRRDMARFLSFYQQLYGHDRIEEWYASVTRGFLKSLANEGHAPATVVRTYATVRHFARWLHRKFEPFPLGCPTEGVKPPREPQSEWKGLNRADELRLLNAAQTLRVRPGRGTNQGLRDHAAVAVLLGSGLRVSELLNLNREQFTGRGFANVRVKGGSVREFVPVQAGARRVLKDWLATHKQAVGPLFMTRTSQRLSRHQLFLILQRTAAQANASRPPSERIVVSPHVLRHTFLRKLAEAKGVQYAKEASGHRSDRYIWNYIKPDRQSLAEAIDEIE